MTIRQIAELCEAGETTIRRWVNIASAKMAGLRAKMAGAQDDKQPAAFTLDETLAIIRAGGKNTLADLLAENAGRRIALPAPSEAPPRVSEVTPAAGSVAVLLQQIGFWIDKGRLSTDEGRNLLRIVVKGAPAPLKSLPAPTRQRPKPDPGLGEYGRLHKLPYETGVEVIGRLDEPISRLAFERALGVSRQTMSRYAARLDVPNYRCTRVDALRIWASIHGLAADQS